VGTVTYRPDLDKLLKQLTAKTGYLFAVKNGKIVIVGDLLKDGKVLRSEVSGIARALVAEMINSSRTFTVNLVRGEKAVFGAEADLKRDAVTIDARDIGAAEFTNVPQETFDLAMVFLHEAGHVVRGLKDPITEEDVRKDPLGDVERKLINPIRAKLGLPERTRYLAEGYARDGIEWGLVSFSVGAVAVPNL